MQTAVCFTLNRVVNKQLLRLKIDVFQGNQQQIQANVKC